MRIFYSGRPEKSFRAKIILFCGVAIFGGVFFCSHASASECGAEWIRTPPFVPQQLKLACEFLPKRRLTTLNRRGIQRKFDRQRALKLAQGRFNEEEARAKFRRLRRSCLTLQFSNPKPEKYVYRSECQEEVPSPKPTLLLSRSRLDFGMKGIGEHTLASLIISSSESASLVTEIVREGDESFQILTPEQVVQHGGIPCGGLINSFCVVMVRLDASHAGEKTSSLRISYHADSEPQVVSLPLTGTVVSYPVKALDSFRTINLQQVAATRNLAPREFLEKEFTAALPGMWSETDVNLFDSYNSLGLSEWSKNWANSALDLSGVAWDVPTAGAAITRCHIIFAAHYPRNDGKPIKFHRKDGTMFRAIVPRIKRIEYTDIGVGLLDPCLPQDWTTYPLVDFGDTGAHNDLKGAPIIHTHHHLSNGLKRISVAKVQGISPTIFFSQRNSLLPSFLYRSGVVGDSGNPGFFLIDGELAVAMTFSYPNSGPSYLNLATHELIQQAIRELE